MSDDKVVKMPVDKMQLLDLWVHDLVYPGNVVDFVQTIKRYEDSTQNGPERVKEFCFYTEQFKYRMYANDRSNDDGYLGCQVSARKARAGEDWLRGNDLADGPFTEATWLRILKTIINYELVILSKFTKPADTPDEVA